MKNLQIKNIFPAPGSENFGARRSVLKISKTFAAAAFGWAMLALLLTAPSAFGQTKSIKGDAGLWTQISENNLKSSARRSAVPDKYAVFQVNKAALAALLADAPLEFSESARAKQTILEVPTPDGKTTHFRIEESPILAPEIAAKYPTWKTFQGQGVEDPTALARFDTNDNGFHGYVTSSNGTYLINPYSETDRRNYIVYYKSDSRAAADSFTCRFDGKSSRGAAGDAFGALAPVYSNGTQLRNYRLAVSASKQYTNFFGGNQNTAFAAVQTTVNRLITVYRRELATTFTIVSDTRTIFTNADDGGFTNNSNADTDRNQIVLDNKYGSAAYDIGHVLSVTPNPDGLAASPSLCNNAAKAQGFTGSANPAGDGFDVDYVAHEIGHQFGMSHTFNNSADGSCTTRETDSAYEPASGVTIMGYGGICAPRNLSANSIEFFHARSFEQTLQYVPTTTGCGTLTATGNTAPSNVNAGVNRTIPKLTPFVLTASAQDADAGLTYSWEEYDLGAATASTGAVDTDEDGSARPVFRSYNPSTQPSRTFPSLSYILNNSNTPPLTYTGTLPNAPGGSNSGYACAPGETCIVGERLPSIARTMNFRVTVRDNNGNGGGVADATTQIIVDVASGPFKITTQNAAANWEPAAQQTINWDVANTSNAPVSAQNVNILLSTDGGNTFPITLAANTPNDGSEAITVPNNPTTQARIKIEAVGNVFFDINDANITVTGSMAATNSISGLIRYGIMEANQPQRFVPGVLLAAAAAGANSVSATSDASGAYQLTGLTGGGNYTVTPSKTAQTDASGINSLDATRIQQHLVGLTTLTANQLIAADTDASGTVNSLDATRIQQYQVNIPSQNVIGQWKFVPGNKQYNSLSGNLTGEDYQAVLIGEVSGNWTSAAQTFAGEIETEKQFVQNDNTQSAAAAETNSFERQLAERINERMTQSARQTAASEAATSESAATAVDESAVMGASVSVSLPNNASASTNTVVTIPVSIGALPAGTSIESFDFSVFFDPNVLQPAMPVGSNTGTLSANCSVLSNSPSAGRVIVSGACGNGAITTGSGVLFNLRFNVIGTNNQTSALSFTNPANNTNTFQFNNGSPAAATTNGQFTVLATTAAGVSVSGRVTNNQGRGISGVTVTMTDANGNIKTAQTSSFGYYRFENAPAGETCVVTVRGKRFTFTEPSRIVNTGSDVRDADFIGNLR